MNREFPTNPAEITLKVIDNKLKALILENLYTGTKRTRDLKNSIKGINQKTLSKNLKEMEYDKIIVRKSYPEVPPKVEYTLTDLGMDLKPIQDSLISWGNNYKNIVLKKD